MLVQQDYLRLKTTKVSYMFRRREESFLKGVSVYMRPVEKGKVRWSSFKGYENHEGHGRMRWGARELAQRLSTGSYSLSSFWMTPPPTTK